MRRAMFVFVAMAVAVSSTGCCCMDRLFCHWGCIGGCGGGGGGGGCGCDGGEGDGYYGGGGGGGGCASCGLAANKGYGPKLARKRMMADDGDGEYASAGPPTGQVAYPYYTNRGPRDFLARNPGNIGP